MEAARLWWPLPLLLAALIVTGTDGEKDLCKSQRKTQCADGLIKISGTCVETTWSEATVRVNDNNKIITGSWFYPKGEDICNLDECFCYCNRNNFFYTAFFPEAPSTKRKKNNQAVLVAAKSSGKCWCHNHGKEVFKNGIKVLTSIPFTPNDAIVVLNGVSPSARAVTYNKHYSCATSRSAETAAGGFPPNLGPTKSATEQCVESKKCYSAGTPLNRPKNPKKSAKRLIECYCNCFDEGYHFAGWIGGNKKICKCFNKKIKRRPDAGGCKNDNQLQVKQKLPRATIANTCCKAVNEKPEKKAATPTKAPKKTTPPADTRSAPQAGAPPPAGLRSAPQAGAPPPVPLSPRSAPQAGAPPPGSNAPTKPVKPDSEWPVLPYDPDFYWEFPPGFPPGMYLIELEHLPPHDPTWPPPDHPDQPPNIFYIVYLPPNENPPDTPDTDMPLFQYPIYVYQLPPESPGYPDPIDWVYDYLLPDPDWTWPTDPDWEIYWPDQEDFDPEISTPDPEWNTYWPDQANFDPDTPGGVNDDGWNWY